MTKTLAQGMQNLHARISLIAEPVLQTLDLVNAGQEYVVNLTMNAARLAEAENFSFLNGVTTFNGNSTLENQFIGDAVLQANKAGTVTLTSYVDATATTSTDFIFNNAGDQGSFSSNSIFDLPAGCQIQVKAKSDTANTTITFVSYKVQYTGYMHAGLS